MDNNNKYSIVDGSKKDGAKQVKYPLSDFVIKRLDEQYEYI